MHILAVLAITDAAAWLFAPTFVDSSAYDLVTGVAGQRISGSVMAVGAVGFVLALSEIGPVSKRPTLRHIAATVGFGAYGLVCASVGLSIFVLSFGPAPSAITGASKWWLVGALTVWQLSGRYYRAPGPIYAEGDRVILKETGETIGVMTFAGLVTAPRDNQL